jgi:hypothetical protein
MVTGFYRGNPNESRGGETKFHQSETFPKRFANFSNESTMIIWWGHKIKDKKLSSGRFDCPDCKSEQPCTLRAVGRYFAIYSIALNETQRIQEYVICEGCGHRFDSASYRSSDGHAPAQPVTWDCPKCKHINPNHSYRCLQCRYSLV